MDAPPPQESLEPFVSVALAYRDKNLHVPAVVAAEHEQGFLLLEDLGDVQFGDVVNRDNALVLYQQALDQLPAIMQTTETRQGRLPAYDRALLERENSLFRDWLLGTHLKLELTQAENQVWNDFSERLISEALAQPAVGVHRDYHSRNLMIVSDSTETAGIGIIDFQDAVVGPVTYDVVSLLRDCYVKWPDELVESLSRYAFESVRQANLIDPKTSFAQWQHWFDWMGMQRHTKASGIFARLYHRDGKSRYLADIPQTVGYIEEVASRHAELNDVVDFLQTRVSPALAAVEAQ